MGISRIELNLIKNTVKRAAAKLAENSAGKSILPKSTEKKLCNFLKDYKKYGLSQGERKALEQKSGKKATDVFEVLVENLSESELNTVVKAMGKKAYQEEYLTAMRKKVNNIFSKATLMKDVPAKPFTITKHDIPEAAEIGAKSKIAAKLQKPGLAKISKLKPLSLSEELKGTTPCKMFMEKKADNIEQPFLMLFEKNSSKQIITESSIPGQYEIFDVMSNGKRFKSGLAEVGKKGEKHVERHLVSTDGKTTDLVYRDDNKGNTFLYSVIKDKNGMVLSETRRKFKKISKNHFVSAFNGQSYDIKWSTDKVVVTKLDSAGKKTKETAEYTIKDVNTKVVEDIYDTVTKDESQKHLKLIEAEMTKAGIVPYTIDSRIVDLMKKLPGDEWFNMMKSNIYVVAEKFSEKNNACFTKGSILMSEELKENFGILAHELGHGKFLKLRLDEDKKLLSIYNKERKKYQGKFPKNMQDSINYFLENGKDLRGLNETTAEANLINNTIQSCDIVQSRTIFLEKYFPETIAYIRNKFAAM